jgi:hypothetical protein
MNTFFLLGLLCLLVATPWRVRKWLYTRTLPGISRDIRTAPAY